jgi:DNA-binding transcriptional regulator LsrR (DeoR family)
MGGLPDVTKENPFSIIQETCRKWNAGGTFLTSFATAENKEARDSFFQNTDTGKMIYKLWEKCDKAIFGIGTIEKGTLLSPELVGSEELETLKASSAIGDVLGHCFDAEGNFITTGLEDRLVAIPIDLLRNIPLRRAVALGQFKVAALLGALKSGTINELFTDDCTVADLLAKT